MTIYNPQIHACVYQVCIECVSVCEMHAHAFALHLCIAYLFVQQHVVQEYITKNKTACTHMCHTCEKARHDDKLILAKA